MPISEVYNMDCMEYMKSVPDKFFELAVVDPPYGLDKKSTHGRGKLKNRCLNRGNIQKWDIRPSKGYFDELFRVSRNQIIWGGNYFPLPPTRCFVCWDKQQVWETFLNVNLLGLPLINRQNTLPFPTGEDKQTATSFIPHKNLLNSMPICYTLLRIPVIRYSIPI